MSKRPHGEWAPSVPYTHKAFRPYVIALGQLTLAWNDLHETLAIVFCSVMGGRRGSWRRGGGRLPRKPSEARSQPVRGIAVADEEHLRQLTQGVDAWNAWINDRVDLPSADLTRATMANQLDRLAGETPGEQGDNLLAELSDW
jgi:hypothetical protein